MSVMIEWARSNPIITRIELDVLATNRHAISLYPKHGFVDGGAVKQKSRWLNSHLLFLWVLMKIPSNHPVRTLQKNL